MRTKAHALIQRRYVEKGITTRIIVLPLPGSGLPVAMVDDREPVHLDLIAGRPLRLELDAEGLSADLCFDGPAIRCHFPWGAVLAVQGETESMTETVAMAMCMEDGTLAPLQALSRAAPPPEKEATKIEKTPLKRPGPQAAPAQSAELASDQDRPEGDSPPRGRPMLRLVRDGDEAES